VNCRRHWCYRSTVRQSTSLLWCQVECPLWREGRSVVCIAVTQWSKSCRICNHTLLSYLRLPQPGRPCSHIYMYVPQALGSHSAASKSSLVCTGGILTHLHTGIPCHLLLTCYVNSCQSQSHFTADSQSVSMSWCRAHFVDVWPDIAFFSRVWVSSYKFSAQTSWKTCLLFFHCLKRNFCSGHLAMVVVLL
jgi:hypothetical protein